MFLNIYIHKKCFKPGMILNETVIECLHEGPVLSVSSKITYCKIVYLFKSVNNNDL